jgi:hypothetical protein
MAFLDLWMGLWLWELVSGERERRRRRCGALGSSQIARARGGSTAPTYQPHTRPLLFLAGQRTFTEG